MALGTKVADAFVELRVDSKKAEAEAKKSVDSLAKDISRVFGAAVFAAGIKKSIDAADGLQEAVKRTTINFGNQANQMEDYAAAAARSMGLSKQAYLETANQAKLVLDNLGVIPGKTGEISQKIVQLGTDLSAYFGVDIQTATDAVNKGLQGATRGLKQFGITIDTTAIQQQALTMGLWDGKGALDGNARAQATLALITEQSSQAQGFFAANASDASQASKIAAAEATNSAASLGTAFLPIYDRMVALVGDLAQGFGMLPSSVQLGVVALLGVVLVVGPLIGKFGELRKAIDGFGSLLDKLPRSAQGAAVALGALGVAVVALDVINKMTADTGAATDAMNKFVIATKGMSFLDNKGAAALGNSFIDLAKAQGMAQGITSKAWDTFKAGFKDGNVQANLLRDALKSTFDQLLKADPSSAFNIANALDRVRQAADSGNESSRKWLENYGLSNSVIDDFVSRADNAAGAQDILSGKADNAAQAIADQAAAEQDLKAANKDLTDSVGAVWSKFDQAAQAADDLKKAIDRVFAPQQNMEQATLALEASIDDLTKSFKENGRTVDVHTEKGRTNREAIDKQAEAIKGMMEAMVASGASTDAASKYGIAYTDQLEKQLVGLGLSKQAAHDYIVQLGLTPANIRTAVDLANAETAKARLADMLTQLGELDSDHTAKIQTLIDEGKYAEAESAIREIAKDKNVDLNLQVIPPPAMPFHIIDADAAGRKLGPARGGTVVFSADGNVFDRPMLSVFGENGPEAVLPLSKPGALSRILSDPRVAGPVSEAMSGAGGGNGGISIGQLNVGSRRDFYDLGLALDRALWGMNR
jgi:hypothetical protein